MQARLEWDGAGSRQVLRTDWAVPNLDLSVCLFPQRWFWLVRVLLSLFIGAEIVGECMVQVVGKGVGVGKVAEGTEKWGASLVSWALFHSAPISDTPDCSFAVNFLLLLF